MYSYAKVKKTNAASLRDAAERELSTYEVFVAGPYIDVSKDAADPDNSSNAAKSLRYFLHESLEAKAHHVYLGEDVKLRSLGEANYGRLSNAVTYERHYIKNHCDAVIILPSSPGSFCELGDWVSDRDICGKMLIIVDGTFKGVANYINEGAVKFAENNGASVRYLSYVAVEVVMDEVEQFLDHIGSVKRIDELYGRR